MKRVLTALVLIPVVLAIVFKAPLWLFSLVVAAIIVLALHEYLAIVEAAGIKPFRWPAYVIAVLPILIALSSRWRGHDLPWESGWHYSTNWEYAMALAAILFGIPLVFRKDLRMGLASVAASVFGLVYVGISLTLLINLQADFSVNLLVFLLFSVWAGDIAAYYVGKNFGRHKLAPVVSPAKTWEGAIASVIGSAVIGWLILHFSPEWTSLLWRAEGISAQDRAVVMPYLQLQRVNTLHALTLGILTNIAAQFGDLFESALKRGAGVKDSGTLIPGHGGILDRIDALLFAIPVVWYYATQTGLLIKLKS